MTPAQAMQLIDQVVSQVSLPRQQHAQIIEAIRIVTEALSTKKKE